MKRKYVVISVFSIIAAVYVILSLLLTTQKNAVFWIGFSFFIFSLLSAGAITWITGEKRGAAFPAEISIVSFSLLYVPVVFVVNILFGGIFRIEEKVFLSIHVVCLAIFMILTLLMFLAESSISKQNQDAGGKIYDLQVMLHEFEKIKSRLSGLPDGVRRPSAALMDSLLDELKYSDYSVLADTGDIDYRIREKAFSLSAEVDNLIEIQADDTSSFAHAVSEIRQLIRDRNLRIKTLSNGI